MLPDERPTGVLLINLGSPDAPGAGPVRRYLHEFLSDPRVLDVPRALRWLLLYGVILPFRPRRSAAQYRSIWTAEGSPLVVNGRALADALAKELGDGFRVALGMRYGSPSIAGAMAALAAEDVGRIRVLPLFPQYASASTGSALARAYEVAGGTNNVPALEVACTDFYDDPGFIAATAEVARPALDAFRPDFVLLSYHGLPERQVRASESVAGHCLASGACCDAVGRANRWCYRAQCFATSRALVDALGLEPERHATAFQSRLGGDRWIEPHTDKLLPELAARGVRRLAVLCPSFVADCLETLEEIGVRAREQWQEVGGEALELVPCVNAHPTFVRAIADRVRGATGPAQALRVRGATGPA